MTDDPKKAYSPPYGGEQVRVMCRCKLCSRWWSKELHELYGVPTKARCACGGELYKVDMAQHVASLPAAKSEVKKDGT